MQSKHKATGHLQVRERQSGLRWHFHWRDADGAHQKVLGKAWVKPKATARTEEQRAKLRERTRHAGIRSWRAYWRAADGPAPEGFLTGSDAETAAKAILDGAPTKRSAPPSVETFGDVAEGWIEDGQRRRSLKPATLADYRQAIDSYIAPKLGSVPMAALTSEHVEAAVRAASSGEDGQRTARTAQKVRMIACAILRHAGREDIASAVRPVTVRYSGDIECYSPEELDALLRATASEQERAIVLTAALTGLRRGELVALTWRDVDFAQSAVRVRRNVSRGVVTTPKSGKVRSVPMVDEVARALDALSRREHFTGPDDPVFVNTAGGMLDASALAKRYRAAVQRAGLRPLPFHSLRHYFCSMAVRRANVVQVQAWAGHADVQTTSRYLHHRPQGDDAALLARAFGREDPLRQAETATDRA